MKTVLAALAALSLSGSVLADTITVCQDGSCDHTTIQAAIDAALSGDEIEIAAGTYAERLTISDKSLELRSTAARGETTTIDAELGGRLLYLSGGKAGLVARNITFANGTASSGGCIYASQAPITLDTCTLNTHDADTYGGAIYLSNGADLSANDTAFTSCVSNNQGGAIFSESGSVLNLTDCSFSSNQAQYEGGAIVLSGDTHTFTNCSFSNNALAHTSSTYTYGAALRVTGSTVTFSGCTFDSNSQYTDNYPDYRRGGAIALLSGSAATFDTCTMSSNVAGYGGAIYASDSSAVNTIGGTADQNEAKYQGGGFFFTANASLSSIGTSFTSNQARYYGGGVHLTSGATHQLNNCTFTGNQLTESSSGSSYGAGLYAEGLVQLVGCAFTDNTHDVTNYPEYRHGGGAYLSIDEDSTLTDCTFSGNLSGSGGGLHINTGTVLGGTFSGNESRYRGGGAYNTSSAQFELCTFEYNLCDNGVEGDYVGGGGIMLHGGTLVDCTFTGNTYRNSWSNQNGLGGGAVYVKSTSLVLDDCTFENNLADWQYTGSDPEDFGGGAVFAYNSTITNSGATSFTGNSTSIEYGNCTYSGGGALALSSCPTINLNGVDFDSNTAYFDGDMNSYSGGGAIRCWSSGIPALANCTFTGNRVVASISGGSSESGGGAIVSNYGLSATDCIFDSNKATRDEFTTSNELDGGAIWLYSNTNSLITGCTFINNEADDRGGAIISTYSSNTYLINCAFTGNACGNLGGALYGESTIHVQSSTFCDNAPDNTAGSIDDQGSNVFEGHCEGTDDIVSVPDEYDSIAEAVRHAIDGDTIEVSAGTYGGTIDLGQRDLSLIGIEGAAVTIIDLEGESRRGIYAPNENATGVIEGLTIRNGSGENFEGLGCYIAGSMTVRACAFEDLDLRVTGGWTYIGGAAIFSVSESSTLTVENCTFTNCVVRHTTSSVSYCGGGAIYNHSGGLIVTGSTFDGCEWRNEYSTSTYSGGGAIYQLDGTLSVDTSTFTACRAEIDGGSSSDHYASGGGICVRNGDVSGIQNSEFTDCSTYGHGGAIHVYVQGIDTLVSCTFDQCDSESYSGGGVFINGDTTATDCVFTNCDAAQDGGGLYASGSTTATDCVFSNCQASSIGGGLYTSGTTTTLTNCQFTKNTATNSSGGGTYINGQLNADNCSFTSNFAGNYGGAIRCAEIFSLNDCIFTGNSAGYQGGAGYFSNSGTMTFCTFENNAAIDDGEDSIKGGAIYLSHTNYTIEDCVFNNNRCAVLNGNDPDHIQGGAIFCGNNTTIRRSDFNDNEVSVTGGNATNSNIGGGAIYAEYDLTVEDNCVFENNRVTATTENSADIDLVGGGAIAGFYGAQNYSLHLNDSTFRNNRVELNNFSLSGAGFLGGGAIARFLSSNTGIQVNNCVFEGNASIMPPHNATQFGGGAFRTDANGATFVDSTFTGNYTDSSTTDIDRFQDGGAVLIAASDSTFSGCTFDGNHCGDDGGAIACNQTTITNCSFTNNGAYEGPSGAVDLRSSFTVEGCTACSNAPSSFGASAVDTDLNDITLRCDGDTPILQVPTEYETIAKAVRFAFDGDTIEIGAGTWNEAIEFLGRDLSLLGVDGAASTIIDATGWGRPAIVADRVDGTGTIEGLTITGADVQGGEGGGMRIAGSMTIRDCVVTGNALTVSSNNTGGAGISCTGGDVTFETVTVSNNTLTLENSGSFFGGGVKIDGGSLTATSCVFDSNAIVRSGSSGYGDGGGLGLREADASLSETSFNNNACINEGANFHMYGGEATVSQSSFALGTAGGSGGGINAEFADLFLDTCTFLGNHAENYGGGLDLYNTNSALTDCTIEGNTSQDGGGGGGAAHGGTLLVINCDVLGNSASPIGDGFNSGGQDDGNAPYSGGGFNVEGTSEPVFLDCAFTSNTAAGSGGAVCFYNVTGENGARMFNCEVLGNSAEGAGGGVRSGNVQSKVTLVDSVIGENSAEVGGGINSFDTRQLTLQNVAVYNNHASLFGGGIYDEGYGGGLQETVINESTISGNTAGAVGGGIYLLLREMAISNTDFCGNDPGQIIGFWSDYGGNTFSDTTCFFDCNANGIEDSIEIAEGGLSDCDGNGIPDICEIADGSAEDCNDDGIPDVCAKGGFVTLTTGTLPAVGYDAPQSFVIDSAPEAAGTVAITIEAIGDFSGPLEYVIVEVNSTDVGNVFVFGTDCSEEMIEETIEIDAKIFNAFALAGEINITIFGSVAVDPAFCSNGMSRISVSYAAATNGDCNGNGFLDTCEIAAGIADDCNGNGIPDECEEGGFDDCDGDGTSNFCEIANGDETDANGNGIPDSCEEICLADFDGDGVVSGGDLGFFLGLFNTTSTEADLNGDGFVDAADLGLLLAAWGPCS